MTITIKILFNFEPAQNSNSLLYLPLIFQMPLYDMSNGKLSTDQLNVLYDKPSAFDSDQDSLDHDMDHDLATGPIVKKPVTMNSMYHSSNGSIATTNRLIATQFFVNTPEIMKQKLAKNGSNLTKCKQPPGNADTQKEEARAPTTTKEKKKKKSKPAKCYETTCGLLLHGYDSH